MHHTCNKHIYISHMRAQIVVLLIGPDEGSHRKASALLSTLSLPICIIERMTSISFNENQYEALVLKVAIVVEGDPTLPRSPAPSNAVGKTPTTDYRLVDLAAT